MTTKEKLKVLMLSSPGSECAISLREAVAPHVDITTVHSLAECMRLLQPRAGRAEAEPRQASVPPPKEQVAGFHALLCEWCYGGGGWKEAVELVRRRVPSVPVIVICRTGGESEWVEVLQSGAADLLSAPFVGEEVVAALQRAVGQPEEHALMKTA
ncbi:MAG TPA: hypothetical protein VNN17_02460 [Terriglobia bacterium]|nr:hypothetical protein [Terriglobia bacterium]